MDKTFVTRTTMPDYDEYIEAIKPLWDSHWITNMGRFHCELEEKLKEYLEVPEISLMVNGHMALEMAIQSFHFPRGSEVITTPFTFISTTHAIVRNGLEPVFCDIKLGDGTIDETKIEDCITEKTVAIIPVHVYGNICNIEAIEKIACKYNLKVIYDAAHAFGVKYKNKGVGNFGDASVFSFHATKVFNTIEGGAVTFSEHKIYDELYNLKNFGIRGEEMVVSVGTNAKMNEFAAIMGLCNLSHIDEILKLREEKNNLYMRELQGITGMNFFENNDNVKKNYSYFPVIINKNAKISRDELYDILKTKGIFPRKYFYPLTADNACFKNKYKNADLRNARKLAKQILVLPFYPDLDDNTIKSISKEIREVL